MLNIFYKHTAHLLKITVFLSFFNVVSLSSQNNNDITFDEATMKIGARIATNGMGLFYRATQPYKKNKSKLLDIDFSSIKNPKEKDIQNARLANTRPYIYNKINKVYNLRAMGGIQYAFADRNSKNSIGISAFVAMGPAITFIKPVYLDVQIVDPNLPTSYINVSRRYNPETIQSNQIIGNSSYFTGIDKTKLGIGLSLKSGVEFNWGSYGTDYKSLEMGIMIDCLTSQPDILYNQKNKLFYSGFYLSFAFGKNR